MYKRAYLKLLVLFLFVACNEDESISTNDATPILSTQPAYSVLINENITFGYGLSHDGISPSTQEMPLFLDVYYPDNDASDRPVLMFIHGGGFQGGTKTKPEIVAMGNYFASRGWVFVAIDYRTTEDLGTIFTGIAPQQWIDYTLQNATSQGDVKTSIAMYAAQRDAKAALRWIIANAETYNINTDYLAVGGASAGAITAIALGVSNEEDFKEEISIIEDPTLATTNLNETYHVNSIIDYWGSKVKLDIFEMVFGLSRYDSNDPDLFIAHGTLDPTVLFSEATELESIYNSFGIFNELVPLVDEGHGPWNTTVEGKSLSDMSFDFLVERQNLSLE